ncbi:hypothetical protein C3L33_10371, partial [Rhododendron williamsianum]
MAGNIRIYDDEDELDAEEDRREPVDGDPVVNDDEDEEDALYMFSIYTWDGGRGERMNSMLDAEEDEREPVDGDAVSDDKDEEDVGVNLMHLLTCNIRGNNVSRLGALGAGILKMETEPCSSAAKVPPRLMDPKKTRQYMAKVQLRGKTRQNERLQVVNHEGDGGDDFDDPDLPN